MFSPAGRRPKARDRDSAGPRATATSAAAAAAAKASSTPLKTLGFFPPYPNELPPTSPATPLHVPGFSSPSQRSSFSPSSRLFSDAIVRSPALLKTTDKSRADSSQPVFVSDFPQELRTALREEVSTPKSDYSRACGGMDQSTGLSWMIHGTKIFIWSHVSTQSTESSRVLHMPASLCTSDYNKIDPIHGDSWVVCIVKERKELQAKNTNFIEKGSAASLLMCSRKSLAVVFWPDVFSEQGGTPLVSVNSQDNSSETYVRSMVATSYTVGGVQYCVGIACQLSGELWRFDCSLSNISRECIQRDAKDISSQNEIIQSFLMNDGSGAISSVWMTGEDEGKEAWRKMLLLTASGLECWNIELDLGRSISLTWKFDVLADLNKAKMLVGQKQVWLLDFQLEAGKKKVKLLFSSYFMDRINGSSYMQYFIASYSCDDNTAQREGEIQIILPKASVEEEEFLYSMRLRTGGKPEGSVMILACDGTATVAHFHGGDIRLYQFDLPWDVGKVVDACAFSSSEDNDGSWLVLSEKAGVWAIPGKTVLQCGVEPPERSLLRRGSRKDGTGKEDSHMTTTATHRKWASLEAGEFQDNHETQIQYVQDEETEALVGQLFHEYVTHGHIDFVLEKLQQAGAFEREGGSNVFALASKALVDTLAKHWTSSMVTNMAMMAAVSSQLAEKQHRHQQFLHFLLASKCLEELKQRQRNALHIILEHGEKLAAMVWLREMHNTAVKARLQSSQFSPKSSDSQLLEPGGALWDLVQLTGEKARRSNVMLLDREKADVFYSRVSELEDIFSCVHLYIDNVINGDQPLHIQVEKVCEITYACTKALETAIHYRDAQQTWYPSPEGLTPWYCKPVVRQGLWKLGTLILNLKEEASTSASSLVPKLLGNLEELADILLEAYAGAITAKVERQEEYRALQREYWERRDILLDSMYQYAKTIAKTASENTDDVDEEKKKADIVKRLYVPLVSLARRHAGYKTLWDICTELDDVNCLRSLMHESMGLKEGRFSNFVFEQCYKNRQFSKLLRLGEEFKEELSLFLQNHKDLLWIHEHYMQQFTLASSTLHWLALSNDAAASVTVDSFQGHLKPSCKVGKMSLSYRKKLLNLAKLSALAGGERISSEKLMSINADIEMTNIQVEAYNVGLVEEHDMLTPRQLAEICLNSENKSLILCVFDIFAWGGDVFRRSNKSLLETAWIKAASQDDWVMMRQISERDGWSDEQYLEALQSTVLFIAAKRCYGEESVCLGGTFEDVLPLSHETEEEFGFHSNETDRTTVETILMQHPDFPDGGEAMLAAVRMGKCMVEVSDRDLSDVMEA